MTYLPEQDLIKGAFGEQAVSEITPVVQIMANYGLGSRTEVFTATGGTATTNTNSEFVCTTGTSAGGYGVIRSKRPVVYKPGQGCIALFTARFTTGVANSLQIAGPYSATDGFVFGYNGTSFGVMRRYGGRLEIQELNITVGASGAETLRVTLNGTNYDVSVTAGTAAHNAHEIQTHFESAGVTAWKWTHIGSKLVFLAQSVGDLTGTFSVTNLTGGGTCAGTLTEITAGVSNTETWVAQASWNKSVASWFDPTKGNVFKIQFQYLGYGAIRFYIENPSTGDFELVHEIKYANTYTRPSLDNPSLRIGWAAASLGSTTDLTVAGASGMMGIEGKKLLTEFPRAVDKTKTGISTTLTNILTLQNRYTFNGKANVSELLIESITGATDSSKGAIIEIWKNAAVSGEDNFEYVNSAQSIVIYDSSGTTISAGVSGILVGSFSVGPTQSSRRDATNGVQYYLLPGEKLTVAGKVTGGAASDITITVDWIEDI